VRRLLLCVAVLLLPAARASAQYARTLTLDASTGSVRVLLYKEGPLRALGHDHVVSAPRFSGQVELSSGSAELTLTIDAAALLIDTPTARAEQGWKELSEDDVAKITAGMEGTRGLDVKRYPRIALRSETIEPVAGEKDLWQLTGRFELHGTTQAIDFPVTMSDGPGGGYWFSGYVRLRPSEYGIKPFRVFGGAVSVKDEALVKFSVLGR
jgi:polyisoprenoid-binding protein YceI